MKHAIACLAVFATWLTATCAGIWLLESPAYAQIDLRNDGGYVGRARDIIDCRGGLQCFVDAGVGFLVSPTASGGSGVTPAGLCGDGGSALGWDGGAYYCADTTKPGSCSAGQYVTAVSTSGAPTCATGTPCTATDGGDCEVWHDIGGTSEPAFQSSWVNFDTSTFKGGGFRKELDGRVWLRGMVKSGVVDGTCASSFVFTLPFSYRPAKNHNLAVSSNGAFGIVGVKSDGNVCVQVGSNTWVSLDGVSFSLQ